MLPLLLVSFLTVPAQNSARAARPHSASRPFLYYDYLEDGALRGGRVALDPANPLHVDLGPRMRGTDPVTTLLDNGPVANRIDIVIVGDGYTSAELDTYAADVDEVWPAFLAEPPLATYASYFNVHRVDVVSVESGVDNDPVQGIHRVTALDMTYWCSGTQRLLCVDVGKAINRASSAPDVDTILALANSGTYGGAGYSDLGTLAGHNGAAIEIALHEFGHSFANLADEYEYGGPQVYSGPEPTSANVSIHDEAEIANLFTKWVRWLDLPEVAAFEGGMYSAQGIYRPTINSKMRSLDRPFQAVNSERFVRNVYRFVDPIDAATPPGEYPLDADFFVDPVDPVDHALDVQWSLDGTPIPGATGLTFDVTSLELGPSSGAHGLSVKVVDNTPLVRSPSVRTNWLTETRSWTLRAGRWVVPHADPSAAERPVLRVAGTPEPGGMLVLELDPGTDPLPEGTVALLFLRALAPRESLAGPVHDSTASLVASAREAGGSLRFEIPVPDDDALSERPFLARAVVVDRTGGRAWSEPRELLLER